MSKVRLPSGAELIATLDPRFLIASGKFPGLSFVNIYGYNLDIDLTIDEDLIPWGGLYAFQSSAVALEVVSTSANDAAAGTGARTVVIDSLDNTFAEQSQTATLNGTTAVALTGTHRRVNRLEVATVGSGGVNAGDVSVRVVSGAVIQSQIPANYGSDQTGVFTVAAGKQGYLMWLYAEMARVAGGTDAAEVYATTRSQVSANAPMVRRRRITLSQQGTSILNYEDPIPRMIVGPEDVWLRAGAVTSNNTNVGGAFALLLEDV